MTRPKHFEPKHFEPKHFELKDFEEAFFYFAEHRETSKMIISTHWASQGYWVEDKSAVLTEGDYSYSGEEVWELYFRIKNEIRNASIEKRNPKFTL